MPHFQLFDTAALQPLLSRRPGETKLGETVQLPAQQSLTDTLAAFKGRFVVLGIPEDIGVRANGGIGGAQTAWLPFLKSFLNIQETPLLPGNSILLLGAFNFDDWLQECTAASPGTLRHYTSRIDEYVAPVLQRIFEAGSIPIVVGGGHNNAYPLLKAFSTAGNLPVNVVNLDAHTDFRVQEGRHSGNGFRYAYDEGYLKKYAMAGLHEAYNSSSVVATLQQNPDLYPAFFEDVFLRGTISWGQLLDRCIAFVADQPFGVELDVDCIENVLSSAATPVGCSVQQALQYLYRCGRQANAGYLHLPEGVSQRADGLQNIFSGKLLSYLVQAFCKGVLER